MIQNKNKTGFLPFRDFTSPKRTMPDPYYEFSYEYSQDGEYKSLRSLFRASSFPEESEVKKKLLNNGYGENSHTEPLCLSAIETSPPDCFKILLPEGYDLEYYKIHLISTFDACSSCTKVVYGEIENLKQKFGPNLFVFFHSAKSFIHPYCFPYTLKYTTNRIRATFNFDDYALTAEKEENQPPLNAKTLTIRKKRNFTEIPPYYIGIIHELEGHPVDIRQ